MTQVSGITKHVSTKISTDNASKEGNQQEAQDGEIQSLEQEEQNGMTQSNQTNKKIMKEKTIMQMNTIITTIEISNESCNSTEQV